MNKARSDQALDLVHKWIREHSKENILTKQLIRKSIKHGKQVYLEVVLSTRKWDVVKKLRRGSVVKYTNLRNASGHDSEIFCKHPIEKIFYECFLL